MDVSTPEGNTDLPPCAGVGSSIDIVNVPAVPETISVGVLVVSDTKTHAEEQPPKRKREYTNWYDENGKRHRTVVVNVVMQNSQCCQLARATKAANTFKETSDKLQASMVECIGDIASRAKVRWKLRDSFKFGKLSALAQSLRASTVGVGNAKHFTMHQLCDMANAKEPTAAARARQFDCAKEVVYRTMSTVALTHLSTDELMMKELLEEWLVMPPVSSCVVPMSDETKENRRVRVKGMQVAAGWQLYVSRYAVAWLHDGDETVHTRVICLPPVAVTSTSAKHLWEAKTSHPFTAPAYEFCEKLLGLTREEAIKFPCRDSAKTNKKLSDWEQVIAAYNGSNSLVDTFPCMNHLSFIGQTVQGLPAFGSSHLTNMFST